MITLSVICNYFSGLECGLDSNVSDVNISKESDISFDTPRFTQLYYSDQAHEVDIPSTQCDLFGRAEGRSDDDDDSLENQLLFDQIDETIRVGNETLRAAGKSHYIPRSPVQPVVNGSIPADHIIGHMPAARPTAAAPRASTPQPVSPQPASPQPGPAQTAAPNPTTMPLPRQYSNRTVTRDLRRGEYKAIVKEHQRTNELRGQILEVQRMKLTLKYPNHNFDFKDV